MGYLYKSRFPCAIRLGVHQVVHIQACSVYHRNDPMVWWIDIKTVKFSIKRGAA